MSGPVVTERPEPALFSGAVHSLRAVEVRPEVVLSSAPTPARIAPFAHALTAELGEVGTGRLVYLHDPAGQDAWAGTDRLVVFVRADVDEAMAGDPMLADVAWSWLVEALGARRAAYTALGGTVTTTASRRYGSMASLTPGFEVEMRCSWTPLADPDGLDLRHHVQAWTDLLAASAGLPPDTPGVVPLRRPS